MTDSKSAAAVKSDLSSPPSIAPKPTSGYPPPRTGLKRTMSVGAPSKKSALGLRSGSPNALGYGAAAKYSGAHLALHLDDSADETLATSSTTSASSSSSSTSTSQVSGNSEKNTSPNSTIANAPLGSKQAALLGLSESATKRGAPPPRPGVVVQPSRNTPDSTITSSPNSQTTSTTTNSEKPTKPPIATLRPVGGDVGVDGKPSWALRSSDSTPTKPSQISPHYGTMRAQRPRLATTAVTSQEAPELGSLNRTHTNSFDNSTDQTSSSGQTPTSSLTDSIGLPVRQAPVAPTKTGAQMRPPVPKKGSWISGSSKSPPTTPVQTSSTPPPIITTTTTNSSGTDAPGSGKLPPVPPNRYRSPDRSISASQGTAQQTINSNNSTGSSDNSSVSGLLRGDSGTMAVGSSIRGRSGMARSTAHMVKSPSVSHADSHSIITSSTPHHGTGESSTATSTADSDISTTGEPAEGTTIIDDKGRTVRVGKKRDSDYYQLDLAALDLDLSSLRGGGSSKKKSSKSGFSIGNFAKNITGFVKSRPSSTSSGHTTPNNTSSPSDTSGTPALNPDSHFDQTAYEDYMIVNWATAKRTRAVWPELVFDSSTSSTAKSSGATVGPPTTSLSTPLAGELKVSSEFSAAGSVQTLAGTTSNNIPVIPPHYAAFINTQILAEGFHIEFGEYRPLTATSTPQFPFIGATTTTPSHSPNSSSASLSLNNPSNSSPPNLISPLSASASSYPTSSTAPLANLVSTNSTPSLSISTSDSSAGSGALAPNVPNLSAPLRHTPLFVDHNAEYVNYYGDYLYPTDHSNYVAWDEERDTYWVVSVEDKPHVKKHEVLRALVRSKKDYVRVLLEMSTLSTSFSDSFSRGSSVKMTALAKLLPELEGLKWTRVKSPELSDELRSMEEKETRLGRAYKFGVLQVLPGQTEDEIFANNTPSADFTEFLEMLGTKIELFGWDKYRGGLDVKNRSTGEHSIYHTMHDLEIIFHVCTMLPSQENDVQRVERKRHIGNDVVTFVFLEPGCEPYLATKLTSQFIHIHIVVQKVPDTGAGTGTPTQYKLAIVTKAGVEPHLPSFAAPAIFEKGPEFRDLLLTKAINAERTCMLAPEFRSKMLRARKDFLKHLYENFGKGQKGSKK